MLKIMWLIKRKKGISVEQFRKHFETSHSPMALKYVGHLFLDYKRSYPDQTFVRGSEGGNFAPAPPWEWDVISEWTLANEEAFNEIMKIMTGDILKEFHEDEDKFLDRGARIMLKCSVGDIGVGKRG